MLIYHNTVGGLLDDIGADQLVEKIDAAMTDAGVNGGENAERDAWRNSFRYIESVLRRSDIEHNVGVAVEFKIPLTSNRVDLMLSGRDADENEHVVVIELKQWDGENVERIDRAGRYVKAPTRNGIHDQKHPCYQAWLYSNLLQDFNVEIQDRPINLHPAAYLHNYEPEYRDKIDNEIYDEYTDHVPYFMKGESAELIEYIEPKLHEGDNGEILEAIAESDLRPDKSLQNVILDMLEGNKEFTLINSQERVFDEAVELAKKAINGGGKQVLIVEGEPGSGKTVVAVNILVELLQRDLSTQYVSKNNAPRDVYEQKLREGSMRVKDINHLFTGSGSFINAESNEVDVLIVDEAHRLNEESYRGRGENQIKEIINAANFSVFFIDEEQRVHIDDIGSEKEIRKHARDFDAEVSKSALDSQLRCAGSSDYIAWVDDLLEIEPDRSTRNADLDYDVQLFDTPDSLHQAIKNKDEQIGLSRVVAGYCWEWDTDHRDNDQYPDIKIGEYERSWNRDDRDGWAIEPGSIDEVGCIHTTQGLEFEYVGVIIGPDLQIEDGKLVTDFREHPGYESSVKGLRTMADSDPGKATSIADELIKNTYRTLMTRGMQGCYVYCCDDGLQEYVRRHIASVRS